MKANNSEARSGQPRACEWCGIAIPDNSRADRKYCCGQCRRAAHVAGGELATTRSVRFLKGGRISVVTWMDRDVGLRPGDVVRLSKEADQ